MKKEMTTREDYEKIIAIDTAEDYFDQVKHSLKSAMEELERNHKHWKDALAGGTYPDGSPLNKSLIINQVIWTVHTVQQINLHHELAARATAKLAKTFDIKSY